MASAHTVEIAFFGNTKDLEAALERAGLVAKGSGDAIGDAFNSGSSKAGNALEKLGKKAEGLGIPFASGLTTAGKHLDEATTKTGKLSTVMGELGKVSLLAGAGIAAGVGAEAVKMGMQYESAQAKIQGATGQSTKAVKELTSAFGGTAGKFESSGMEMESAYAGVAGQMQATEGHALGTAEAMKVMSSATDLNTAVQGNLAETTSALSSVMQAFHLSTSQASQTSDTLYNVSTRLNVPIGSLATAMDKLHARLGTLSPSLADMGGLMVSLGEHGVSGSRGIQVVSSAMSTLVGGSEKTTKVLQDLGVNIFNSQGKFIGMQGVIAQLGPKLAGLTQQQQIFAEKTLFGAGAYQVMGSVIQSGAGAYQKATDSATKVGTAQAAAAKQAKSLHGEFETAKSAVETFAGVLGLDLTPELRLMGRGLSESIQWMEKHKTAAYALGGVITGVLGLAVSVFAYQKAVAFVHGTQEMVGGIGKLVSGITSGVPTILGKMGLIGGSSQVAAGEQIAAGKEIEASLYGESAAADKAAGEMAAAGTEVVGSADATATGVDTALGATGVGLVLVGLGLAAVELEGHWKEVMSALESAAQAMANVVIEAIDKAISDVEQLTLGLVHIGKIAPLAGAGGEAATESNAAAEKIGQQTGGQWTTNKYGPTPAARSVTSLENLGLGGNAAQGVVKALMAETNQNLEKGAGEEGAEGAYGIAQWLGSRRAGLETFAKGKHKPKSNLEVQLEYLAKELQGPEHGTLTALQHAHGINEASGIFIKKFERPEVPSGVEQRAAGYGATSNKALQEQMEEASGAKPKKAKAGTKAKAEPYVDPFANAQGLTRGRTDQGVDFDMKPGSNIDALGAGIVTSIAKNWYKGQPLIEYQLTQGARKGQHVYAAEQINPDVSVGEHLKAGQKIGTYAEHGTGLEMGFGAGGGKTLAQATTGYTEGQVTKAGQEFSKFIGSIGKGGTALSLMSKAAEAAEKALVTLRKSGETLQKKYEAEVQTGTTSAIEKALGVGTSGKFAAIPGLAQKAAETGASGGKPLTPLTTELSKSAATSVAGQQFAALVAELKGAGLTELASRLVTEHRRALDALAVEMVATEQTKLGEQLKVQATEEKDRTAQAEHSATDLLNVVKDQATQQTNAMKAAGQAIADASQSMSDSMTAAAQMVEDQSKVMAAASNQVVQGIKDQTNIEVSILGERGLYGLNLIAQKEEVQLDEMKASYDQQIAQGQREEAQLTANWQQVTALDEQTVDQDKAMADAQEASAQAHLDSVTTVGAQRIAAAQAEVDAAQLQADQKIGNADLKVLAATNAGKEKEAKAAAGLKLAEGEGASLVAAKEAALKGTVEPAANAAIQAASNELTRTTESWSNAIKQAELNLAKAKGEGAEQLAKAQQSLTAIEDKAAQEEAAKEKEVAVTRERSQTQYAGSGLVINQYGLDMNNATANAAELGWALRTQLPA